MTLAKHSNWPSTLRGSLLSDFFDDDQPLWFGNRNLPAVNIKENDKNYDIEIAAPGYDKNDFNIAIDNNLLTVSAQTTQQKEKKDENFTRREFGCSSFSRSFNLPMNTNEEDVNARYEGGILKLTIAKKDESNGKEKKTISIK